jgi:hypothetical protein
MEAPIALIGVAWLRLGLLKSPPQFGRLPGSGLFPPPFLYWIEHPQLPVEGQALDRCVLSRRTQTRSERQVTIDLAKFH